MVLLTKNGQKRPESTKNIRVRLVLERLKEKDENKTIFVCPKVKVFGI
jgi:hypothetical protein